VWIYSSTPYTSAWSGAYLNARKNLTSNVLELLKFKNESSLSYWYMSTVVLSFVAVTRRSFDFASRRFLSAPLHSETFKFRGHLAVNYWNELLLGCVYGAGSQGEPVK
jgi:hypothetical protein